jgi:hypothetical protein
MTYGDVPTLKINVNRITINISLDVIRHPCSWGYGPIHKMVPYMGLINSKAKEHPVLFAVSVCDNLSVCK